MSFMKYRLKELAADFGMQPKEIAEIMGKFFEKPKSNTQVLTEEELNVLFDYITRPTRSSLWKWCSQLRPLPRRQSPR